jgi:hypothetical protein
MSRLMMKWADFSAESSSQLTSQKKGLRQAGIEIIVLVLGPCFIVTGQGFKA